MVPATLKTTELADRHSATDFWQSADPCLTRGVPCHGSSPGTVGRSCVGRLRNRLIWGGKISLPNLRLGEGRYLDNPLGKRLPVELTRLSLLWHMETGNWEACLGGQFAPFVSREFWQCRLKLPGNRPSMLAMAKFWQLWACKRYPAS